MQKLKVLVRKVLEGNIDEPDLLQYLVYFAQTHLSLQIEYLGIFDQEIKQKNGSMIVPVDAERFWIGERDRMTFLSKSDTDFQKFKRVCIELPGNDWGLAVFRRRRDGNEQALRRFIEVFRTTYLRYQIYLQGLEQWGTDIPLVIIGQSPLLIQAISRVERCARSEYPVILQGETGTGKELFARALHVLNCDTTKPFHAINCAHLQSNELVKSELFGHQKRSFTGAITDRKGAFLQANEGTLFLDEIETLTPEVQAMLLRVLEFGMVTPVGSDRPVQVHARLVAATNRDIEGLVATGEIREDFYHRLMVHNLHIPSLRDRGGTDILELTRYFLQCENSKQSANKVLTPDLEKLLIQYPWPGNVREVHNVVLNAFYESGLQSAIRPNHVPSRIRIQNKIEKNRQPNLVLALYEAIVDERKDFWREVYKPYRKGDFNRSLLRELCEFGFTKIGYRNIRELGKHFNIENSNQKKFYDFVHRTIFNS